VGEGGRDHGMLVGEDSTPQVLAAGGQHRVFGFCGEENSRVQGLQSEDRSRVQGMHAGADSRAREIQWAGGSGVHGVVEGEDSCARSPGSMLHPTPPMLQPLHMPHTQPQLRPYLSSRPSYTPQAPQLAPAPPLHPHAQPHVLNNSSRALPLCLHPDPPWQGPPQSLAHPSTHPSHLPHQPPHTSSHHAPPSASSCQLLPAQPAHHPPLAAVPSVGKLMPQPVPAGKQATGKGSGFPTQAAPHRGKRWAPRRAKGNAGTPQAGCGQPPNAANKPSTGPNGGQVAGAAVIAPRTDHPPHGQQQTKNASSHPGPKRTPHALNKKAKRQRACHAPNKNVSSTGHTNGSVLPKPAAKFGPKKALPPSAVCTGNKASSSHPAEGHACVAAGAGSSHHGKYHQQKRQRIRYMQGDS